MPKDSTHAPRSRSPKRPEPPISDTVRTRQLEVVDSKGNVQALLGGPDDVFGLTIFDGDGRKRVFLRFREDGGNPSLDFSNGDDVVASFGIVDAGPHEQPSATLDLMEDSGQALVRLAVGGDRGDPHASVTVGEYDRPYVDLSASADAASVVVAGEDGMAREALHAVVGDESPVARDERTVTARLAALEARDHELRSIAGGAGHLLSRSTRVTGNRPGPSPQTRGGRSATASTPRRTGTTTSSASRTTLGAVVSVLLAAEGLDLDEVKRFAALHSWHNSATVYDFAEMVEHMRYAPHRAVERALAGRQTS